MGQWIDYNVVGNKAKGRISKRVFQENKAHQCLFFGKFGVLCFLETPVLRFALLPYYRRHRILNVRIIGSDNVRFRKVDLYMKQVLEHSFSTSKIFSKTLAFFAPLIHTHVCISGGRKCWFFGKFCVCIK